MGNSFPLSKTLSLCMTLGLLITPSVLAQNNLNPNHFYLVKGELIQRSISLGDPTNWSTSIQGREG